MAIAADVIEQVRSRVNLVEIVQPHIALRRVGRRWQGLCPFHAEKTPSFYVNEELGLYKCFGCNASGDVITFVREIEHLDFAQAVEYLAARAGVAMVYTDPGDNEERKRKRRLLDAVAAAVDWYHDRLLSGDDAGPARAYLRDRGFDGDMVRAFRLGWAPDEWDALVRALNLPSDVIVDTGLGYLNRGQRQTDAFRGRILFPIFNDQGDPVAFGGRVLPGAEGHKYKNSPETKIYSKSRTLYGLNWAKAEIVRENEIIVCEGYTDVIGFHQAGMPRAVATCGTALTEEHVRLMKKFANRVVLAFDADGAGQGAAERFYEWEHSYDVTVAVAAFPVGSDPADLARRDPEALRDAITKAKPFLAFRLDRLLGSARLDTPEAKARAAEKAIELVNEHPNVIVRRQYAGEVAMRCGLPAADLVRLAERGSHSVRIDVASPPPRRRDSAEIEVLRLLVHRWSETARFLVDSLFADDVNLLVFRALAEADGDVRRALEVADPMAAELLGRLAVEEPSTEPEVEAIRLIIDVSRRRLDVMRATGDPTLASIQTVVMNWIEDLRRDETKDAAAGQLLRWLDDLREGAR
ncbi:MAG: DNA primase [Acidimicrobiales bacterium]